MWKKYGTAEQTTDDNKNRHIRSSCRITKVQTHTQNT